MSEFNIGKRFCWKANATSSIEIPFTESNEKCKLIYSEKSVSVLYFLIPSFKKKILIINYPTNTRMNKNTPKERIKETILSSLSSLFIIKGNRMHAKTIT